MIAKKDGSRRLPPQVEQWAEQHEECDEDRKLRHEPMAAFQPSKDRTQEIKNRGQRIKCRMLSR